MRNLKQLIPDTVKARLRQLIPATYTGRIAAAILSIGLVVGLWYWRAHILDFVISFVAGGVIASLVATLIAAYFLKDVWKEDVKELKADVANLKQMCGSFLGGLPDAIGGKFTTSLLRYNPLTSEKIAAILGDHARELYSWHYDRIAVIEGIDAYHLKEKKQMNIDATEYPMWPLAFNCRWTWCNDSQVTCYPLKDFVLLVSAPDIAMEAFTTKTGLDAEPEREELRNLLRGRNYVRTILEHPGGAGLRINDAKDMWKINKLTIKFESSAPESIPVDELEPPSEKLRLLMYKELRLPKRFAALPLERSKRLSVEYQGEISIPARQVSGQTRFSGTIVIPPSDVIAGVYSLSLIYPKAKVAIDTNESGCWFLQEKGADVVPSASPDGLLGDFHLSDGDAIARIKVDRLLRDLHRIWMVWSGE